MNNNQTRSVSLWDVLNLISVILQLQNNEELERQTSTDDLMSELQRQDTDYFRRILSNQEKILSMLSERNIKDG